MFFFENPLTILLEKIGNLSLNKFAFWQIIHEGETHHGNSAYWIYRAW